jgi:NADPH-dependent curcumin reductase CurA
VGVQKQVKMQGFLVSSYAERFAEAREALALWPRQAKLKYREEVAEGIESAPQAFIGMLQGKNQGKQLVRLSE